MYTKIFVKKSLETFWKHTQNLLKKSLETFWKRPQRFLTRSQLTFHWKFFGKVPIHLLLKILWQGPDSPFIENDLKIWKKVWKLFENDLKRSILLSLKVLW